MARNLAAVQLSGAAAEKETFLKLEGVEAHA